MMDLMMEDQVTVEECPECGSHFVDECACGAPVIYVDVYSQGKVVWSAEAEDVEAAVLAARTGWDESWDPCFSKSRKVRLSIDGQTIAMVDRRP